MIKLFVSDLDGTLFANNHQADEKVNSMIHEVLNQNRYFSFATGRSKFTAKPKEIDCDIYMICLNGAAIFDREGNVLFENYINQKIVKELLDSFPTIDFDCQGIDTKYIRKSKEEWLKEMEKKPYMKNVIRDEINHIIFHQSNEDIANQNICKIDFKTEKTKEINAFLEKYKDEIANAPSEEGKYEITSIGIDKEFGVRWLMQYLHLDQEEVAVYGDGKNDVSMLQKFTYSYSPCDASKEALESAHEWIGRHDEYSVVHHILKTISQK